MPIPSTQAYFEEIEKNNGLKEKNNELKEKNDTLSKEVEANKSTDTAVTFYQKLFDDEKAENEKLR